ncbi:MAG: ABC transporter ATP-binding protein, partial [Pseudomonadota bacterium]
MTELRAHEISVQTQEANLVSAASFVLKPGEFTVVLGPNGAGKTSLIRASLGLLRPTKGTAAINGQDVMALSPIERAKQIAYLPQMRPLAWPNRVRNIVALGLFSHGAAPARLSAQDALAVEKALQDCDLVHLADRHADTLSGGEIARMHCARSFVANAPLLIADEPIAALDPRHQFGIL